MTYEISPEAQAAADAYVRTLDIDTATTRRVLTVGRSTMVHALDENTDIWGIKHRDMAEGQTYAEALCGQRSPAYNRNHGTKMRDTAVAIECKKCLKVVENMKANRAAKAAAAAPVVEEVVEEVVVEAAPVEDIAADVTVVTEEDGTTIESYTTEDADLREVQWTEITFPDASRTIKRRKQVSGAWRTDYWGAEFAGDAEHYTTATKVKAAIAARSFTR